MKYPENLSAASQLDVDFFGFIFYQHSKRFVGDLSQKKKDILFHTAVQKVGVFVDEKIQELLKTANKHKLDYVQLHGNENPAYCRTIRTAGIKVIKAFGIHGGFDFALTSDFSGVADYFLFDTKSISFGGGGKKFDWQVLDGYQGQTPFFLSGGIKPEDAAAIKLIGHPRLAGIDLNSGFEMEPGLKNIELIKEFIANIR